MSPGDVDSLEVTTSEGQVPLAGGYKALIRNFQGMYSVCEKQINWSDGMLLALRWEDYRAYMHITSHNSWCYSGNIPRAISIDPPFPPWVPPSNLASCLPPTPSCSESIVESKEYVEPKESIRLDKDVIKDSITDKDIKEVPSISTSLLEIPTTVLPSKEDANGVLSIIGDVAEGNLEFMESFSHLSPMRAPSLMMFAVDPQLQSFHHGHQAFSTVKLKVYTNGEICMVLSDPSGHSVIPTPYQNHGESVTECSLLESVLESPHFSFEPTDFSLLKSILESPHFSFEPTDLASPHLLETDDLSTSVLATISPVFGMQTADA
jgi:hypothetical protein